MFHLNEHTLKQRIHDIQEGYHQNKKEHQGSLVKKTILKHNLKKWLKPVEGKHVKRHGGSQIKTNVYRTPL
nr:hypothetical protein [Neobacillus sp. Marseille-Q6967]